MAKKNVSEKVVKAEEAPKVVVEEVSNKVVVGNVTQHLDRDPNDPRLVKPADELPTLDKE